jgi:hypothetical protein
VTLNDLICDLKPVSKPLWGSTPGGEEKKLTKSVQILPIIDISAFGVSTNNRNFRYETFKRNINRIRTNKWVKNFKKKAKQKFTGGEQHDESENETGGSTPLSKISHFIIVSWKTFVN